MATGNRFDRFGAGWNRLPLEISTLGDAIEIENGIDHHAGIGEGCSGFVDRPDIEPPFLAIGVRVLSRPEASGSIDHRPEQ